MNVRPGNIAQISTEQGDDGFSFLPIPKVQEALRVLLGARIHPHFAGYLVLCRTAAQSARKQHLQFRPKEFFDTFLKVPGLPETTPYVLPFRAGLSKESPFFNANVAGSYAPSSLREVAPFRRVAEMSGSRGAVTCSIPDDHAQKAFDNLLFKERVNVGALSVFLYRDFGFISEASDLSVAIAVFREDFGFRFDREDEAKNFDVLFVADANDSQSDLGAAI